MISIITRRKHKSKGLGFRLQLSVISFLLFLLFTVTCYLSPIYAISDPLAVSNNKFGIHIISPSPEESSPAADLVNSNGDWGYVTFIIEGNDRKKDKWQNFFNDLRRRHLIPIVRIATQPEGDFWKRPIESDAKDWASFLNELNWPIKNRYVTIYNEPNHAQEWGGVVDAKMYAKVLDQAIIELKNKNRDFFVLNAGLDASTPHQLPRYEDELSFLTQMNEAVPGIFEKLDGWVSHSYPNPEFAGSPDAVGKGTVRTYLWEMQQLKNLGVTKNLPIFITETGWKHAEGITYNPRFPTADTTADYYKNAFENAWNHPQIVAVTPFLLNYQQLPFDHFSFKKITGEKQQETIIKDVGAQEPQHPNYYSMYQTIKDMPKTDAKPVQEFLAKLKKGEVYSSIVAGETYDISLSFENTGQSIWSEKTPVRLLALEGGKELGIDGAELPKEEKIEPGQEYTFKIKIKAPLSGTYKVVLNLFEGNTQFASNPVEFTTEVKSPVVLLIKGGLSWKKEADGNYILTIKGTTGENSQTINLEQGMSQQIEARQLLPDYSFDFTLEKPFYKAKTIHQTVYTGINTLDFGSLQPDLLSALLHPKEFWKLLPFSN